MNVGAVAFGRQPFILARIKLFDADRLACRIGGDICPTSDSAAETRTWQRHALRIAGFLQVAVPASQTSFTVAHVGFAYHFVYRVAHGNLFLAHSAFAVRQFQREAGSSFDVVLVFDLV